MALGARAKSNAMTLNRAMEQINMRTRHLLALLVLLAGCSTTATHPRTLTADKAGLLAQQLANEQAKRIYNCQPFHDGLPAQFVQGHWTWHDLKAQGPGDIEATVEFEADGAAPKVSVIWLDSRPKLLSLPLP